MSSRLTDTVTLEQHLHKQADMTPEKVRRLYAYIFNLLHEAMTDQQGLNDTDLFESYVYTQGKQMEVDARLKVAGELLKLLG